MSDVQEQYASVWAAAVAVANRLSMEAVEYDDEDGHAFNLTVAASIVATALVAERDRCAGIADDYAASRAWAANPSAQEAAVAAEKIAAAIRQQGEE